MSQEEKQAIPRKILRYDTFAIYFTNDIAEKWQLPEMLDPIQNWDNFAKVCFLFVIGKNEAKARKDQILSQLFSRYGLAPWNNCVIIQENDQKKL